MLSRLILRISTLSMLASLMLLLGQPAHAQQAVLGTVTDSTGAVVPEATVTLTNTATEIKLTAPTNDSGNYQFPDVPIGVYEVAAAKPGFTTAVASNVRVLVNARQRVDLVLTPGKVSQTVTVSGGAPLVESETSTHGQVVHEQQITQLPLNDRDPARLVLVSAGATLSAENNRDLSAGGREGAFNINGLRSDYNNYMLDGVDNNEMGTSNQGFSYQVVQLSPDALQEFKVVTNSASAEYGRAAGAIVLEVTKSGTNQYRGDLWEFNRNKSLNAAGFFTRAGKPAFVRNQFGGTFGGPIVRNRAFFFADAEIFRQDTGSDLFATIPTLNDRQGIFSVPVKNPLAGEIFPANTPIPKSKMSPFAVKVLSFLPPPNRGSGARSNDLETLAPNKEDIHHEDLRLDWRVNSKLNLYTRASNRRAYIFSGPDIPGLAGGNSNGSVHVFNQALAVGGTWTLTPNSLLDMRLLRF